MSQFVSRTQARHRTISFVLSWREGRQARVDRLVVRRYAQPWTWWTVGSDQENGSDDGPKAQREWAVMRWLYGVGLPVPALYALGDDYVLIANTSGHSVPSSAGESLSLVEPYVADLARILAQVHRLVPPANVRDVLPQIERGRVLERLSDIADRYHDRELSEATMELDSAFQAKEEFPPCVLCGEAVFAAAQFDARGVTALPNWDNSALGDPRWDVVRATHWLRARQADALADRFLVVYQDRAGQTLTDMEAWSALVAAQSWAMTTWLRDRDPQHLLLSERDTWIESTWRTLAQLRHMESA
ncbi:MAG: phosphotransferase [Anaerolineae bacterium]|nr:phosphotransferase [Anaerolineae bacterium]